VVFKIRKIDFYSPAKLAKEVKKYYDAEGDKFSARPFNRFRPVDSIWWCIPSKDWPAYKYGKFLFFKKNDLVYLGFNVEKGLGQVYKFDHPNKHITDKSWLWEEFLSDIEKSILDEILNEINQNLDDLFLEISFVPENSIKKSGDFEKLPNKMIYKYKNGDLIPIEKNTEMEYQKLNVLRDIDNLYDLVDYLKDDLKEELNYFWIDFNIKVPFKTISEIENEEKLDIYQLDNLFLSYFERWLKCGGRE